MLEIYLLGCLSENVIVGSLITLCSTVLIVLIIEICQTCHFFVCFSSFVAKIANELAHGNEKDYDDEGREVAQLFGILLLFVFICCSEVQMLYHSK